MLILSADDLIGLLPPPQIIAAVESALRAQESGLVQTPKRLHLDWKGNVLLAMPAVAEDGFGVKLVSVVPENASRGLPVTNGVMILNDGNTGMPLALMNAGALTAQRTGAVGALGVKYMTPANTTSVGVVGCGVQGAWQAIFACAIRPVKDIFAVSRSDAAFETFVATVTQHAPGVRITRCADASGLLENTDLVIAATTSSTPVLPDEPTALENKHFISVGSFKPAMQELPSSVYRLAGRLAVDCEHARHEVGDVINPLRQGIFTDEDVFPVSECVTGKRIIDTASTTAYKSVGAALYDLFVAQAFYSAAKARGIGREVAL